MTADKVSSDTLPKFDLPHSKVNEFFKTFFTEPPTENSEQKKVSIKTIAEALSRYISYMNKREGVMWEVSQSTLNDVLIELGYTVEGSEVKYTIVKAEDFSNCYALAYFTYEPELSEILKKNPLRELDAFDAIRDFLELPECVRIKNEEGQIMEADISGIPCLLNWKVKGTHRALYITINRAALV